MVYLKSVTLFGTLLMVTMINGSSVTSGTSTSGADNCTPLGKPTGALEQSSANKLISGILAPNIIRRISYSYTAFTGTSEEITKLCNACLAAPNNNGQKCHDTFQAYSKLCYNVASLIKLSTKVDIYNSNIKNTIDKIQLTGDLFEKLAKSELSHGIYEEIKKGQTTEAIKLIKTVQAIAILVPSLQNCDLSSMEQIYDTIVKSTCLVQEVNRRHEKLLTMPEGECTHVTSTDSIQLNVNSSRYGSHVKEAIASVCAYEQMNQHRARAIIDAFTIANLEPHLPQLKSFLTSHTFQQYILKDSSWLKNGWNADYGSPFLKMLFDNYNASKFDAIHDAWFTFYKLSINNGFTLNFINKLQDFNATSLKQTTEKQLTEKLTSLVDTITRGLTYFIHDPEKTEDKPTQYFNTFLKPFLEELAANQGKDEKVGQ